jgi:nucleotide-binding universal stress UspA family protein
MGFADGLKTIVVATDLDGRSEGSLEYARKIALAYGARIILAHGTDPMEYAAVGAVPGKVLNALPEEARTVLERLSAELLRQGIHAHSEVRQGAVTQTLVDVARQYKADMIVIGTKGAEGVGPVVVGAVAEELVRLVNCPVLAVAADWNAGPNRPTPGGSVLLAVERNEATAAAVATARSLAQIFERPLIVVHAITPGQPASADPCASSLAEFGLVSTEKTPVQCMVIEGAPADAIAEAIDRTHPSILVAGVKRASETPGPHGTAFALLVRSRVPVLCVPPEQIRDAQGQEACAPAEIR